MVQTSEDSIQSSLIELIGPWPFITRQTYHLPDQSHAVWRSREHRKGLTAERTIGAKLLGRLWMAVIDSRSAVKNDR